MFYMHLVATKRLFGTILLSGYANTMLLLESFQESMQVKGLENLLVILSQMRDKMLMKNNS